MAVYKIDVRVDVENSLENFKKDLADLVKRADTAPHKIKVQLDRESFEKEIADLKKSVSSISSTNLGTTIKTAPIKKEATEVVSVFDQIENRIKSIGTGQGSLSTMRDAFKSIKPVLENNTELTTQFVEVINQIYGERYFVELTKDISKFSKGIITATQLTKSFENTIKMQDTAIIPKPIEIDDTAFKKLKAIQTILRKAQSFESGEVTSYSKSGVPTGWEITSERLFSVIKQEASDAQLKVLGLNRELMSLNDVRQILDSIAKDTHDGLRYNNDPNWVATGMDYVTTNNNIIRRAIEDQKELTQRTKENDASLVELRNTLQNTFGDLPNKNGSLAVSLDQLKQIENEAPAATEYIYEIERGLNKSLYNNRGATETPISQIKVEAEEAASSEEHLMTVTQELTETVSDGIGGNGFVPNLDDIQQAVNGIVDSIKALNSELQKIKQVDTPTSRGIRGGSSGNQSVLSIAQEEELAYAEWNKIQKEQQRVHDQTIISWNKVGDAAEKEEQRIERATQREIESHYKAEQASEEAAFKELEARRAAEEKKQSEIARSLADFETKLQKEEADVVASTQKEIEAYYKAEQAREASIERTNEKMFAAKEAEVAKTKDVAFKELEVRQRAEAQIQSEIARGHAVFDAKLRAEEEAVESATQKELDAYLQSEESREAKIEKENEKLFQSHVKTFAQRRELEEQRAHEENEAYQSGLRKAEQAVAKEVELEKQKYQQELDALEKYERAREAKIEKENEKLFQSHVRASQDANLQAKWQSQGLTESNIKSLFGKAKNNKDLFEGIEGGFEGLTERYREVLALHEKYKDKLHDENDPVVKNIENRTKALKEEIEAELDDAAAKKKTDKAEKDKQSLLGKSAETVSRLRKEYAQWTAAAKGSTSVDYHKLKDFADSIDDLIGQLSRDEISPEEFKRKFDALTSGARQSEAAIKSVGKNTQSLGDRVKGLATKFGAWLSISQVVMAAVRAVKKMISTAQEIDAAMTQLKIVTNATNNEMKEFSNTAITLAKDLGKSVTELTKSIETFSRLGYSLKDASELAKYATIMSNVAGVSADEATTGLTSIVKGYNLDVSEAEHVADILVDVGQKYAVSASEMMDAFEKSGAALHATNTSLEKSAGLIASANASVQDSSVIGTALKTVSARVRGKNFCASVHSNMYAQELHVA